MDVEKLYSALENRLTTNTTGRNIGSHSAIRITRSIIVAAAFVVMVDPVMAQAAGSTFCQTALARTVKNIFTVIQFGGPLIGGVVALGSTVALSAVRRADLKRELKEMRNQGIVWGVIVAPLGTVTIQFILNNIVAGGGSCAF